LKDELSILLRKKEVALGRSSSLSAIFLKENLKAPILNLTNPKITNITC
jgi:hypothetical protein